MVCGYSAAGALHSTRLPQRQVNWRVSLPHIQHGAVDELGSIHQVRAEAHASAHGQKRVHVTVQIEMADEQFALKHFGQNCTEIESAAPPCIVRIQADGQRVLQIVHTRHRPTRPDPVFRELYVAAKPDGVHVRPEARRIVRNGLPSPVNRFGGGKGLFGNGEEVAMSTSHVWGASHPFHAISGRSDRAQRPVDQLVLPERQPTLLCLCQVGLERKVEWVVAVSRHGIFCNHRILRVARPRIISTRK